MYDNTFNRIKQLIYQPTKVRVSINYYVEMIEITLILVILKLNLAFLSQQADQSVEIPAIAECNF